MKTENALNYKLKLQLSSLLIGLLLVPQLVIGQIRAGVGYLKMLPGAREVGAAGTVAAALDYTYAFYTNPGAAGFIREWQWSATYTNWISDIYHTSFLYGRKLATPWSRYTKLLLGVNYLGIPEFTNSNQIGQVVSGNSLLVTGSLGQPLGFLTNNLALGANVKYFSNKLAQFNTDALIWDVGLLYRTPRFNFQALSLGLFDWLIFSSGVAITNLGQPLQFIAEETPLPRTLRGGVAINMGRHRGLQYSLGLDYREVRDETGYFVLGSEISWRQVLAFRLGYSWEDNLLGHFTFGGSIRLDEQLLTHPIFGRNNALRIDLATNENNPVTDSPYHGTMTHQPQGPEKFRLLSPAHHELVTADSVVLKWELTRDPDLYDAVNYRLVVDRDSARLAQALETATTNGISALAGLPLLVNQPISQAWYSLNQLRHGVYFWAVLAYDLDEHVRFAEMQHRPIAKFLVTAPEPKVLAIDFDYSPWITTDDYQGILRVTIANVGNRAARDFTLVLSDKPETAAAAPSVTPQILGEQVLPEIAPNDRFTFTTEWRTRQPGLHQIQAEIALPNPNTRIVHAYGATFYTIPKGTFTTTDTVSIQEQFQTTYEFPYLGKIFFDSSRAEVPSKYIRDYVIEPPLVLFARRLRENPHVNISLQGAIDPNSGETDIALAQSRAEAVRDTLQRLGVSPGQMTLLPGRQLPPRRLPANPEDQRWVLEERRYVDITTDEAFEVILFSPLHSAYFEKTNVPMHFDAQVAGVVPFRTGEI
ncbi:PorV/PorQ family protein, partial [candidate division KSB1 bacterium]|nr:PorV/PorQ family protein [candidate division KSB1 bacterium]